MNEFNIESDVMDFQIEPSFIANPVVWITEKYQFFPEYLQKEKGFIFRQFNTFRFEYIVDVDFKQSIWQRMLGVGTVYLNVRNNRREEIVEIKNIREYQEIKSYLLDRSRKRYLDVM